MSSVIVSVRSSLAWERPVQRLAEIGNKVRYIFDTDGQPDESV